MYMGKCRKRNGNANNNAGFLFRLPQPATAQGSSSACHLADSTDEDKHICIYSRGVPGLPRAIYQADEPGFLLEETTTTSSVSAELTDDEYSAGCRSGEGYK